MKKCIISLALFVIITGCIPYALKSRYSRVAEKVLPKTVSIYIAHVQNEELKLTHGGGVIISPEGHILTCAHLFDAKKDIKSRAILTYTDDIYNAEVLYMNERRDLALLRVYPDKPMPYATIADPRTLKVGQEVIAIGAPLGMDFSVTNGIISALYRDVVGFYNTTQSNADMNPGNSGGGLFNMQGELIGINSFMFSPVAEPVFTGLGFSIQCGQIMEFLTKFKGLEKSYENR